MKHAFAFTMRAIGAGFLVLIPIYHAFLLLLKALGSVAGLVKPVAKLLPHSIPAESLLSLLFVLLICMLVGAATKPRPGQMGGNKSREPSSNASPATRCCVISPSRS